MPDDRHPRDSGRIEQAKMRNHFTDSAAWPNNMAPTLQYVELAST